MIVNDPETLAAVSNAFHRYEQALMTNDLVVLDEPFLDSPETLRFGSLKIFMGLRRLPRHTYRRFAAANCEGYNHNGIWPGRGDREYRIRVRERDSLRPAKSGLGSNSRR